MAARSARAKARNFARENIWAGFVLLGLFALVALLGGGARADIASLLLLRPVAIFFLAIGLAFGLTHQRYIAFRPLLLFVALIVILIAAQLVPLPAGLWSDLPGREPFARAAQIVGLDEVARPLSLYPALTWNALLAALVASSVLVAFVAARPRWRHFWLFAVLVFGFVSAIIGLLQTGGPADGPLYFYRITNEGSAVGLFSNRNHHAVLISLLPPLLAYATLTAPTKRHAPLAWLALLGWLFLAFMIMFIGSRLGLFLFAFSSAATLFILPREVRMALPAPRILKKQAGFVVAGAGAVIFALVALFATNNTAVQRLFKSSLDEELRARIVPTTLRMIGDFFPFGGGGGTFPQSYFLYEPAELMIRSYVNHVHNDYLEIAYAYGLPGIALIFAAFFMVAFYGWVALRRAQPMAEKMATRVALVGLAIFFIASLTDYPLRTPSLAVIALLFAATLLRHRDGREKRLAG